MSGRLTAFAATLKEGDHVQIQGQPALAEYVKEDAKKARIEVQVTSIFALDRSRKQSAPAQGEMQEAVY